MMSNSSLVRSSRALLCLAAMGCGSVASHDHDAAAGGAGGSTGAGGSIGAGGSTGMGGSTGAGGFASGGGSGGEDAAADHPPDDAPSCTAGTLCATNPGAPCVLGRSACAAATQSCVDGPAAPE